MALGIHALDIGVVVLSLAAITGTARRIRANRTSDQQASASTHRSALIAANGSTGYCANRCADSSTTNRCLIRRLLAASPTDLCHSKVTANIIIGTETLSRHSASRQNHDIGAIRHDRAGTQQQKGSG